MTSTQVLTTCSILLATTTKAMNKYAQAEGDAIKQFALAPVVDNADAVTFALLCGAASANANAVSILLQQARPSSRDIMADTFRITLSQCIDAIGNAAAAATNGGLDSTAAFVAIKDLEEISKF